MNRTAIYNELLGLADSIDEHVTVYEIAAKLRELADQASAPPEYIDVVFDGPTGPVGPRFVETEDPSGASIRAGEWIEREDGYHAIRIPIAPSSPPPTPPVMDASVADTIARVRAFQKETNEAGFGRPERTDT